VNRRPLLNTASSCPQTHSHFDKSFHSSIFSIHPLHKPTLDIDPIGMQDGDTGSGIYMTDADRSAALFSASTVS
jgi:hypothetical protein